MTKEVSARTLELIAAAISYEVPSELSLDNHLEDDLGFDSLDAVELIMNLEKEFNIGISDSEAEELSNCRVSELIDCLLTKIV